MHDEMYGTTIHCECGRSHHVTPDRVMYGEDASEQFPAALAKLTTGRRVIVIMDENTREVAGANTADDLRRERWDVREIVIPASGHGLPVCDDHTHSWLAERVGEIDVIVSVGGGVLCDLAKWIALDRGIASATFATAASMNGYTSPVIAAAINGLKTVVDGRPPRLLLSTPRVLREAPYELTTAGLGDVVAKPVSTADWRMCGLLFGDYQCERVTSLIVDIESLYLNNPEGVLKRSPAAIEALFDALCLTGVGMNMVGASSPSSGAEHLVSHTLDMLALRDNTDHDFHGRQVGIGTILASAVYERILALDTPTYKVPTMEADGAFWGTLSGEIKGQLAPKRQRVRDAVARLGGGLSWDTLRAEIKRFVLPPSKIRDCLSRAGAAFRAEDIGVSKDRLTQVLERAHQIRTRFTALDLARIVGILPGAAREIVEEWV
ncbi:MAG: iron-containing alcohol dehydrogenase [Chitinivibrionales bacterium]|nr:iron-containing alcohol dehydrogenase [Chitinivibrionales bacterium]MBD3357629.1 iron-containing alcohol dehydrogenase [Chitinivibrionales bacterium]